MRLDQNGHKLCYNVKDIMQKKKKYIYMILKLKDIIGSVVNYDGGNLGKLELMHDTKMIRN